MIKRKDRRAISVMIGYILLISAAVVMSVIVYQWLKTYVPKDAIQCPDETSLFIKDYACDLNTLNITIRNNGNFNIAGYFIRASDKPNQEIAAIDLSEKLQEGSGRIYRGNSILFAEGSGNSLISGSEITNAFDVTEITDSGTLYFIEIIPIRFQEEDNKILVASCGNKKVKEDINCT